MESCAECRARQQRERQYLEKLRRAAVPEASEDLTARLLARTGELAAERAAAERPEAADAERTAAGAANGSAAALPQGGRRGSRLPVLAVGGAVAALALMAGAAYAMGGDDAVPADGGAASAPAPPDTAGLPASSEPFGAGELDANGSPAPGVPGSEATVPLVAFGLGGAPDFAPAGTLSAGQLAAFRSQGWTCPELRDLGFHLIWARAGLIAGDEVLELRLTDGGHFATVLEQHTAKQAHPTGPAPARAGVSPMNVLTGHAAVADGFTPVRAGVPSAAPQTVNGAVWVNASPPYRAIYQTSAATYTYISDLPAEQAGAGVAGLTRAGSGAPVPASRNGIPERIVRGLSRIMEHLAP